MLDPSSPVPLYQQLKEVLRREIAAGRWEPHRAIPPERELVERWGISRITVRQALADLVAEGILYRRHGKGTYVSPAPAGVIAESLSELTGHLEELQLRGLDPRPKLLRLGRAPLPDGVARALEREPGAEGYHLFRLVSVAGAPLMLSEVWLPADLGLALDRHRVERTALSQLLQESGWATVRGRQRIGAECAGAETARLLGIAPGEPILRVVRVIIGAQERPLVWFRTLYRGDRYEYEVELKRRR
ncbi:MAG: GntR family transcriptional regulator [Bacillota bacterium]